MNTSFGEDDGPSSLLLSVLPYHLQYVSIDRTSVPQLSFALIKLMIEAGQRPGFFSWTETDETNVSLLIDNQSINQLRQDLSTINVELAEDFSTNSRVSLIGRPLRAIQVLEGYAGHVDRSLISEVSGCLAQAGFSIFYQSTNRADFVLVQSEQLLEVLDCLADKFIVIADEEDDSDDGDEDSTTRAVVGAAAKSQARHRSNSNSPNHADHTQQADQLGENVCFTEIRNNYDVSEIIEKTSILRLTSGDNRELELRSMPYSLMMRTLTAEEVGALTAPLLQLIFFDSPKPRFFSYSIIDHEFSLIAGCESFQSLVASAPPTMATRISSTVDFTDRWNVIEAVGVFGYEETGLVSAVAAPLSSAGLRFFYYSSWKTGFVLVHTEDLDVAKEALTLVD